MLNATPLLGLYARYRNYTLRRQHPTDTQLRQLLGLIRKAQGTIFGRAHDFASIRTISDYQRAVPLRTYEQFWNEFWKASHPIWDNLTWPGRIPYFAVSSGTSSGTTKYLPLNREMIQSNAKAGMDILVHHVNNCPHSALLAGKCFMLGGSTELVQEAPDAFSGDLSGITVKELPWWLRPRYFPPLELALLKNWEEKIAILGKRVLEEDIRMLSGVPSWMLIFIDYLASLRPNAERRLVNYLPNLEIIVHGGVNFAPYYDQFKELLIGSKAELREVYPASEGFIAVADRGYHEGLKLVLDHGIFYEFVPVEELSSPNPTRHWVGNIEKDVNYAVVLTTCAGIWSYILGDTVRFVDLSPPRLLVTGRTSYTLSAFGEHLIAEEVEDAVSLAASKIGHQIADYSVGALYPKQAGDLGGHLYIIEFHETPPSSNELMEFAKVIDQRLSERNEDYMAHRAEGFGLKAPQIKAVPHGTFLAWMKQRGKLGGQNKVPRLVSDPKLFKNLSEFSSEL